MHEGTGSALPSRFLRATILGLALLFAAPATSVAAGPVLLGVQAAGQEQALEAPGAVVRAVPDRVPADPAPRGPRPPTSVGEWFGRAAGPFFKGLVLGVPRLVMGVGKLLWRAGELVVADPDGRKWSTFKRDVREGWTGFRTGLASFASDPLGAIARNPEAVGQFAGEMLSFPLYGGAAVAVARGLGWGRAAATAGGASAEIAGARAGTAGGASAEIAGARAGTAAAQAGVPEVAAARAGAVAGEVTPAVSQAAGRLGVDLATVPVENGVARVAIGTTQEMRLTDLRMLGDHLRARGVRTVEIDSGLIQNTRLGDRLVDPARRASLERMLGGRLDVRVVDQADLGALGTYRILRLDLQL